MKISELRTGRGAPLIEGRIVSVDEEKQIEKYGKTLRVAQATLKDASASVTLTLWNDQIDMVKAGCKVKIENGYVNEWNGERQLTLGKFGKMVVLEKD